MTLTCRHVPAGYFVDILGVWGLCYFFELPIHNIVQHGFCVGSGVMARFFVSFSFSIYLTKGVRAGCFTLILFNLSVRALMFLSYCAMTLWLVICEYLSHGAFDL